MRPPPQARVDILSTWKSKGQNGAVDKHPNFHAKFTSIWYNKKNGRGVKI